MTNAATATVPVSTESLLLDELAGAWESLDALHDITATLAAVTDTRQAFGALVARLARVRHGLAGGVWLERAGQLERADSPLPAIGSRSADAGVIGHALARRASIVVARPTPAGYPGLEREFAGAAHVLVVPFTTPSLVRGALAVWGDGTTGPVDSRLVRLAESLAPQAALIIENANLAAVNAERERFAHDVEIAARIQQVLLAADITDVPAGLQVAALARPARQVGGDFYDVIRHAPSRVDLVLGDAMGKGVPAALLAAAAKIQLTRAFATGEGGVAPGPDAIVRQAHRRLIRELLALDSFVTLGYARLDWASRTVTLVDAGHGNSWRITPRGRAERLTGHNLPLGVREGEWYEQTVIAIGAGDTLLMCSDGVTDARDRDGRAFGDERLLACLRDHAGLPPAAQLDALRSTLDAFTGCDTPEDDQTVLLAQCSGGRS